MSESKLLLFAGPSLAGIPDIDTFLVDVELRPPIQRGELPQLIEELAPGTVAIVDGMFHQTLAVGHIEIRLAMEAGWRVWGLASMGAIRACEMDALGMKGFGYVYERFAAALRVDEDFQDDEVALIHEAEFPYRAGSEPLVHIRVALDSWVELGRLTHTQATSVVDALKSMWYGDRTLAKLSELLLTLKPSSREWVTAELRDFQTYRVKSTDLHHFLTDKPWKSA